MSKKPLQNSTRPHKVVDVKPNQIIKAILPEGGSEKFGKSGRNKVMEDYLKRAESEANRGGTPEEKLPENIIPERISEAASAVQKQVQAQAAREVEK